MNFAFPALIILVIALPGIFFRFAYRKSSTGITPKLSDITHEIAYGVCIAVFIHLILISFLHFVLSWPLASFNCIIELLAGNNLDQHYSDDIRYLADANHLYIISVYTLVTIAVGYGLGWLSHFVVKFFHLDFLFPALRFEDRWRYFFNGAFLQTEKFRHPKQGSLCDRLKLFIADYKAIKELNDPPMACVVSILVEFNSEVKIYEGILVDYRLNALGDLDMITLSSAARMKFIDKNEADLKNRDELGYVDINGERLIIPYATIKNINIVTFMDLPTTEKAQPPGVEKFVLGPLLTSKDTNSAPETVTKAPEVSRETPPTDSTAISPTSSTPSQPPLPEVKITVEVATAKNVAVIMQPIPPKSASDGTALAP